MYEKCLKNFLITKRKLSEEIKYILRVLIKIALLLFKRFYSQNDIPQKEILPSTQLDIFNPYAFRLFYSIHIKIKCYKINKYIYKYI